VDGASDLLVAFADGTEVAATVVGQDDLLDIAVVQLDLAEGARCRRWSASATPTRCGPASRSSRSAVPSASSPTPSAKAPSMPRAAPSTGGYGLSSLIQHDAEIWHETRVVPLLNLRAK
jgi:S1-C subfamily serine protease